MKIKLYIDVSLFIERWTLISGTFVLHNPEIIITYTEM